MQPESPMDICIMLVPPYLSLQESHMPTTSLRR